MTRSSNVNVVFCVTGIPTLLICGLILASTISGATAVAVCCGATVFTDGVVVLVRGVVLGLLGTLLVVVLETCVTDPTGAVFGVADHDGEVVPEVAPAHPVVQAPPHAQPHACNASSSILAFSIAFSTGENVLFAQILISSSSFPRSIA